MKKSFATRIRITKTGKLLRRPMGIGHSKAKRSGKEKHRKIKERSVNPADVRMLKRYFAT